MLRVFYTISLHCLGLKFCPIFDPSPTPFIIADVVYGRPKKRIILKKQATAAVWEGSDLEFGVFDVANQTYEIEEYLEI